MKNVIKLDPVNAENEKTFLAWDSEGKFLGSRNDFMKATKLGSRYIVDKTNGTGYSTVLRNGTYCSFRLKPEALVFA